MPRFTPLLAVLCLLLPFSVHAHSPAEAIDTMTDAAQAWLNALSPEQRRAAQFSLTSDERENWHYVPRSRQGVALGEMTDEQRRKARALLASGLSQHGLLQAEAIIALERVLRVTENAAYRDETRYFFSIFDLPATHATWGWRVEGHHLSINFTVVEGRQVVATPYFAGANPAEVRNVGPQIGKRALAAEEDLARQLVVSLTETQRARAVFASSAPGDILTRALRVATPLQPAGLKFSELDPAQQERFRELLAVYLNRLREEFADSERQKLQRAGWQNLTFAWAGGFEPGQGHYYRIQGTDFVIEYDNTQNGANHIHTVWRSFAADFGRDLLQEHYREAHR